MSGQDKQEQERWGAQFYEGQRIEYFDGGIGFHNKLYVGEQGTIKSIFHRNGIGWAARIVWDSDPNKEWMPIIENIRPLTKVDVGDLEDDF